MVDILQKITAHKKGEVAQFKLLKPIEELEKSKFFKRDGVSLKQELVSLKAHGIIAEFKRKSPSKHSIYLSGDLSQIIKGYEKAGASAVSILTDNLFFGGTKEDLIKAKSLLKVPILRKDFIIDEYQILESKSIGADIILLIAACLSKAEIYNLAKLAKSLSLEVLLEIHSESELVKLNEFVDFVGINNRNLKTFEVDLNTSKKLFSKIPSDFLKISESGISDPKIVAELKAIGFSAFLIGEHFMKTSSPGNACKEFIALLTL